jgi:hypothetical protein
MLDSISITMHSEKHKICTCGNIIIPHVIEEGNREHYIWWDNFGHHCNCIYCEINHERCRK